MARMKKICGEERAEERRKLFLRKHQFLNSVGKYWHNEFYVKPVHAYYVGLVVLFVLTGGTL